MIVTRTMPPAYLLHDPRETFEQFQARQRAAYQAGKWAWREGVINAAAVHLYDELVRCVGANRFAWIKEDTLAAALERSVATIRRWMGQLVRAGLIRRERRFGLSSLTSIVAYDMSSAHKAVSDDQEVEQMQHDRKPFTADCGRSELESLRGASGSTTCEQAACGAAHSYGAHEDETGGADMAPTEEAIIPATQAVCGEGGMAMDLPIDERTHEITISAEMRSHTYEDQHSRSPGGDGGAPVDIIDVCVGLTQGTTHLLEEGVVDPGVLGELCGCPVEQIEQVVRYVARCRSADDPRRPGLIVHLLRRGFGLGRSLPAPSRRRAAQSGTAPAEEPPPVPSVPEGSTPPAPLMEAWQQVLYQLEREVPHAEFMTWLKHTALLAVEGDEAVVATPNIFVRQEVEAHYQARLEAALHRVFRRRLAVLLVIESSP